ncbi:hypothetical protein A0H81_09538 [Grifola frondosa]|uniref:Uncharacterized protein n=1 Tax=Grifola frondosa TaxID=5627 RepID=A0A1C7M255_GRIFR|nr:hypothetical protein A0H81_09538 [Grifola frondosa]
MTFTSASLWPSFRSRRIGSHVEEEVVVKRESSTASSLEYLDPAPDHAPERESELIPSTSPSNRVPSQTPFINLDQVPRRPRAPSDPTQPTFSRIPIRVPSCPSVPPSNPTPQAATSSNPIPNPPAPILAAKMTTNMPARGYHTAPTFKPSEPRTLGRYFEDLEYLFGNLTNAPSEAEKKKHVIRYVPVDTADMWDQLPSYADAAITYADWRDEVKKMYPTEDKDRKFTMQDLDRLV